MRLQHLLVTAACVATATMAGCSTQDCTLVGGLPGIVIQNPEVLTALGAVQIRVCVTETACEQQAVARGAVEGPLRVDTELLSRRVASVTVSATDVQGAEVLRESKPVTPIVSYPNGKGCDPTVWNATVTL